MIWLILLLAFALRLINLNQSLWLDEAIGAIEVQKHDLPGLVNNFLVFDNHTPFYYLTLDIWTSIFGYSEISLRAPSVILGVATVYMVYRIAKLIDSKHRFFPLASALVIATSQFHVYFSQEARMYAMAGFFASLAVYSFMKVLEKGNWVYWVIFSLSLVLLVFTDYMPAFLWPIFPIYAIYKKMPSIWWKKFIASQIPLALLSLLWLPVFITQITNYSAVLKSFSQWRDIAGGASVKNIMLVWIKFVFGRVSLLNKTQYYLLVLASAVPVLIALVHSAKVYKKHLLLFLWFVAPLVFGILASAIFPAFNYFRYVYIFPAWCLLIGLGLSLIKSSRLKYFLLILIITFNFIGLYIYNSEESQQREQWRQAVEYVEGSSSAKSLVVQEFPEPFAPYRWYKSDALDAIGGTDDLSAQVEQTITKVSDAISGRDKVFYFEYLADLSDPQRIVLDTIIKGGFKPVEEKSFVGVGKIIKFEKYE